MSEHHRQFYINGAWVAPSVERALDVINPATEQPIATIALGAKADVDAAVAAARAAFPAFAATPVSARIALLGRIIEVFKTRLDDLAHAIQIEMGAPAKIASRFQAPAGLGHFGQAVKVLEDFAWHREQGNALLVYEPIGVCGLITPWNWPINQITCKVAPALAAGCAMVLKPSEIAPLDAIILAEILDEAGVPAGVFNLVHGTGPEVGAALASHPDLDMISFTGSTRAGVAVAQAAAPSIKRVHQELGGKSANIILPDAPLEKAVTGGVRAMMLNTGQSCNAGTRMLVPKNQLEAAAGAARSAAEAIVVGDPAAGGTMMGPVASEAQFEQVQRLIQVGIDEGATLIAGGPGRPEGLDKGYFVRPTVFSDVNNQMTIAREEIFGPVLVLIPYETEDEAVQIANDSPYGLAGYVSGGPEAARRVALQLRTGAVQINGARHGHALPFGGYKQSGNGKEWGRFGFEEFLELKAIMGYN